MGIIVGGTALYNLITDYFRTPTTRSPVNPEGIVRGVDVVAGTADPALRITVDMIVLSGPASTANIDLVRKPSKWDFDVNPYGRPIDLRKLARGSRTVLALCAGAALGGFFIGTVADVYQQRSRPASEVSQPPAFHGGMGGLALGLVVRAGAAAGNAFFQAMR